MAEDIGTLRHTWTDVNQLKMHSLVSVEPVPADAPVVVLVHGSGLSGRYMIPTARELTADFRVYVPDLPGFGDSGKPQKVLSVPELADWVADWMIAIGLPRGALLGNSFGCRSLPTSPRAIPSESSEPYFRVRLLLQKNVPGFGNLSVGGRTSATIPRLWPTLPMTITENAACAVCYGLFATS